MMKPVLGWHILHDPYLAHGDNRPIVVGETLSVRGKIRMCKNGLHASRTLDQARNYNGGSYICRVRVWGSVVDHHGDKFCGRYRKVLWMVRLTDKQQDAFDSACRDVRYFGKNHAKPAQIIKRAKRIR